MRGVRKKTLRQAETDRKALRKRDRIARRLITVGADEAAERLLCGTEQQAIEPGTKLFQFMHEDEKQVEFGTELDSEDSPHDEALSEGDSLLASEDGRHDVALYEAGCLRENEEVVVNPELGSENDDGDEAVHDEALYEVEVVYKASRCRDIGRSVGEDNLAKYMWYDSD
ncbi:hypothetical protein DL767_006650 [Monosporascus sp. MG133]|nr:hypothetical protein DL767_006650 [Monosporascus sp. MG133]